MSSTPSRFPPHKRGDHRDSNPLTRLIAEHREPAHDGPCNHGSYSPKPTPANITRAPFSPDLKPASLSSSRSPSLSMGPSNRGPPTETDSLLAGVGGRMGSFGIKKTTDLAEQCGVKNPTLMYLSYYIPSLNWIKNYRREYLLGDIVAGISMASFYIPMALSLSANLAHLTPIHGLYAFAIQPFIYALLGSCPQMVVGPEAPGSLLLGTAIRASNVHHGPGDEEDQVMNSQIASVITTAAGLIALIAGIVRLGFLDSVLSRPLLRGFISAVGWVIFVDQLIPEMGLQLKAKEEHITHASSVTKLIWLIKNFTAAHKLTFIVATTSFITIMLGRVLKQKLGKRFPYLVYLPDRFLVVVFSAIITDALNWDERGLAILGKVDSGRFQFHLPFQPSHVPHFKETISSSFLIAVLGFFESVVAAKSIASTLEANMSGNRELVALGFANVVGGCFQALPAFGGYGRSKVNRATGGQTPVSSIVLSLCTVICIMFLLPYFYYLPRCVLSAMISVVAVSLLEEAPADLAFFMRVRGYQELFMMTTVFVTTIIWSLQLGMAVGVGMSVVQVIRHSTRARIMILGRVPGTDTFKSAEDFPEEIEFIEGCLIVKIPEPLTFANTGELKNRLRRLELYGTSKVHPSLPRMRSVENNKNVIFDVHGVTRLDGSGAQVLKEIVTNYAARGVSVYFSRVPPPHSPVFQLFERSGIVEIVGGKSHFVNSVDEALRLTDIGGTDDDITHLSV